MNVQKRNLRKNQTFVAGIVIVFAIACAVVTVLCFKYYAHVGKTVQEESESYILEISKQMGNSVSRSINDNFSALYSVSIALEDNENITFEQFSAKITKLRKEWKFEKVLLLDGNSVSYNESGETVRLNNDVYIQDAVSGRNPSMSTSEIIEGKECITFIIPVEFSVEGHDMLAMVATYELETFDKILSMSAFDGNGFAHIVRKNGTVVVRSSSVKAFETGYNILNSLEKEKFDENDFETMRLQILEGSNGFVPFSLGKEKMYLAYIPLATEANDNDWRLMTFVPVSEVNGKSELLLQLTLIMCTCIVGTFTLLLAVILFVTYRGRIRLEKIAYVDSVTGGNTIQLFYEDAAGILKSAQPEEYALIFTNLEKFKLLNEQYGRKNCDKLLEGISSGITARLDRNEQIGRLSADNFCLLVKLADHETMMQRILDWKKSANEYMTQKQYTVLPFMIGFGVYVIKDPTMTLSHMIDRAKLALSEALYRQTENIKYAVYDDGLRNTLVREKFLEDQMEHALYYREFEVYLQPKYNTDKEQIAGAEALVRWNHPTEGLIYPNDFIPLFEKNGFIKKLDMYVYETVCERIQTWIGDGLEPKKISINCSRTHLKDNFLQPYTDIAAKYHVPHKYLELEFTETVVFGDVEHFSKIIADTRAAGFGCSMDDFGSGYSSLSLIQDIPIDTIKLDKVFFRERPHESDERTEAVIASIISLSKALSVMTVAEGVENKKEVEMLKKLGCDMIQGFYFAKPMPIAAFEKLAFSEYQTDKEKRS